MGLLKQAPTPEFREPIEPTRAEICEAITDYARTAAKMPTHSGMGWLNDKHSSIHAKINQLLEQLGL